MIGEELIGKKVLIRTINAGVHIGTLSARDGMEVLLEDSIRMWNWNGALSCSELAEKGCDIKNSKIAVNVKKIIFTQTIEIIPVSKTSNLYAYKN